MKNLFKKATVLTLVAGTALSLASCGGGSDEEHTIVFYSTMGDKLQDVANTAIAKFEEKNPGWKIEHNSIGNYDTVRDSIIGDLQGGTQPDLAYCYPDHVASYLQTGKVIDLAKFINGENGYSEAEVKDFVPGYYKEGLATNYADYEAHGYTAESMLTLPFIKSTEVLYYNEDALTKIGVDHAPETWDELWEMCVQLKAQYPKSTPLGYDSEANWFITMCVQNGWGYTNAAAPHFAFNNENTEGWLTDLKAKFDAGLFTTQEIYGSYTSNLFTKGADEGSVFSIGSSGGASHQASNSFKWNVAPLPGSKQADGTINKDAISQGPSLVMLEGETENKDEKQAMTWAFIKELLDPAFQCKFSLASGYNPARLSAYDNDEYVTELAKDDNIVSVTASVAKSMSDNFFVSPAFKGSTTARDQVGSALVYAVTGQNTPAGALAEAIKKCGK